MVIRSFVPRNSIQMSTGLIITMAWLLEVIFLSLYIRLRSEQMPHAALIYTPLMCLSCIVIMLRVILVPNSILNVGFPPLLLAIAMVAVLGSSLNNAVLAISLSWWPPL